jgi:hypothetical protein
MLWYKAWRDTRWRFLIGLALLLTTALGNVLAYHSAQGMLAAALRDAALKAQGQLVAGEISLFAQLSGTFRGYVWVQVVHQNLLQIWTVFAVLLGAEGLLSQRMSAPFILSLPVSRSRLCGVRQATDLLELCALAVLPMILITLVAPAVGHSYALADALVYGFGLFGGGAVFYGLALVLATVFNDRWRPIVITLAVAIAFLVCKYFVPALAPFSPVNVMDGESYFRTGAPAWPGLLISLSASAAMLYAATRSIEKRDF